MHLQRQITHRPNPAQIPFERPIRPHGKPGHGYGHGYDRKRPEFNGPSVVEVAPNPASINLEDSTHEREMLEVVSHKSHHHDHEPMISAFRSHDVVGDGVMIGNRIYTSDPLLLAALQNSHELHTHQAIHDTHQAIHDNHLGGHHHHHHLPSTGYILAPKVLTSVRAVPLTGPAFVAPSASSVIALGSVNRPVVANRPINKA